MGGCISGEIDVDFSGPVDFNHFHILRAIGKGAFGKVCIVKKKDTKEMYAMKYMNKVQIIHKHAVENVLREGEILRKLEHSFLVNLWFTFQDQEDLFMVLDLMLGGDISYHLEKEGRFPVARVRLYIAELSLALEYLREHRVIHRDVKPANMLLDSGGHVHLTDFNVACIVHSGVSISSVTGTKPYMAPEVLHARSSGYSYAVDWWSLGVSVYEMLRGQRPFSIGRHMTNEEIVSNIRHTRPSASIRWDHQTCDLLRMLLHPDEDKRLKSVDSLKQHRFFQTVDWDQVESKETTPIYIPAQNRIHCDPTHELEEMIVEPNPLHKKHHRLSRKNFKEEDETLVGGLERLERRFPEYNRVRLKEVERRKASAQVDGDIQQTDNLRGSSLEPGALTTPDRQSHKASEQVETKNVPQVIVSDAMNNSKQQNTDNQMDLEKCKESETVQALITCEEELVGESAEGRAAPEDEEHVAESQVQSVRTEEVNFETEKDLKLSDKEPQQTEAQTSDDCSSPDTASSGSSTHLGQDLPASVVRTDSSSSAAMLLPREL